ncbi:hypothetical protein BP00DRAFT_278858 [Aspergillus indologenus CBS 114.80]|uniref:Uncharacterized protein n=1 Tax=Aspergillus indologenus CBS 114.80 TaxID=1450541 RepID=A0A2V5J2P7_9EURO|nr:hypothetical protein BP00DRAFT_278858 [Aspergillus indologenus CBS 114.80]
MSDCRATFPKGSRLGGAVVDPVACRVGWYRTDTLASCTVSRPTADFPAFSVNSAMVPNSPGTTRAYLLHTTLQAHTEKHMSHKLQSFKATCRSYPPWLTQLHSITNEAFPSMCVSSAGRCWVDSRLLSGGAKSVDSDRVFDVHVSMDLYYTYRIINSLSLSIAIENMPSFEVQCIAAPTDSLRHPCCLPYRPGLNMSNNALSRPK